MNIPIDERTEWLEADGLGGFACGTTSGVRSRRYHALLVSSASPPTRRFALVGDVEAWLDVGGESIGLGSHLYEPGTVHPQGTLLIESFTPEPWPAWVLRLPSGDRIVHERFMVRGAPVVVLSWRLLAPERGGGMLRVRPLLACRDYHGLQRENPAFRFEAERSGRGLLWRPYGAHTPGVAALANGEFLPSPTWYRGFLYREERARGFPATEDLASPGEYSFDLSKGEAVLIFGADAPGLPDGFTSRPAESLALDVRRAERSRRSAFKDPLERAAETYIVRRAEGLSLIAGYPWFADWGRDTFVSLRGLCLATGRLDEARAILLQWADQVSEGMLPNRFADDGEQVEFNSVDASLWFVVCVHEYLEACESEHRLVTAGDRAALLGAVDAILDAYSRGTRHGIRADADGLLAAGEPGVQLTWMDARVGDRVVTARIGKPVEVQALWVNALWIGSLHRDSWSGPFEAALASFRDRFWNAEKGCLFDVVDVDHVPGREDPSLRPNQILAVGGLPLCLLDGARARAVVDRVERDLLTPIGLRSLDPAHRDYQGRYEGGPAERDGAYHQGTVWPWLMGPFVEAWVRVRGGGPDARHAARERFLAPMVAHLGRAGLGHISEIADGDPPHEPRGCPFQAWSLGELLRLRRLVLAERPEAPFTVARSAPERPIGAAAP